jgi:hypothetical protein
MDKNTTDHPSDDRITLKITNRIDQKPLLQVVEPRHNMSNILTKFCEESSLQTLS